MDSKKFSVSDAINKTGMSKVVWIVFWLTCVGMLFDGYDYMMVSYTMTPIAMEWGLTPAIKGTLMSWTTVGVVIGAIVGGTISDKLGRRKAFLLAVGWYTVFTVPTALSGNLTMFLVFRVLSGVGMGAFYPISAVYTAEFAPGNKRGALMTITGAFNVLGWVCVGLVASALVPKFGWHSVYLTSAVGIIFFIFVAVFLPESPQWQIAHGQGDKALKTIKKIVASKPCDIAVEDVTLENLALPPAKEKAGFGELFAKGQARYTISMWITCFFLFFTVFGITTWLPSLLMDKGFTMTTSFSYSIANNAAGILACFLIGIILEKFGRRHGMIIAAILAAVGILFMAFVSGGAAIMFVAIVVLGLMVNMLPPSIMPLCAEMYPTSCRNMGQSWMQAFGRSAAIFSPIIAGALIGAGVSFRGLFLFFLIPIVIVLFMVLVFLKKETKGVNMEEV